MPEPAPSIRMTREHVAAAIAALLFFVIGQSAMYWAGDRLSRSWFGIVEAGLFLGGLFVVYPLIYSIVRRWN